MIRWPMALLLLIAAILIPARVDAQVCTRGIPCGNTCIAANRTCRVGPGTARAAPGSPGATRAPPPAAPRPTSGIAIPQGAQFVASSRGRVFYSLAPSCSAWRSLSVANLRWFKTQEEAAAAGYTPSASRGCRVSSGTPATQDSALAPSRGGIDGTGAEDSCSVSRVIDGDTLDCADGRRIRLLLIDAPEMDQGPFGEVAKVFLSGLVPAGTGPAG